MENIIWRPVVGYEGLYEVSNTGQVRSMNYNRTGVPGLLHPEVKKCKGSLPYLRVIMHKDKRQKKFSVHRLVAQTFLPNPENKPEINHKDEDKTNNFVFLNEDGSVDKEKSNLEWKNHRDNLNHGTRNERVAKALSKRVLQLSLSGELIKEWPSTQECGRNGFNQGAVAACCRGEKPHYKGFLWMYK